MQVDIYKDLINRANDIYYSRVEKLLDSIANVEVGPIVKVLAEHVFPSYLSCQHRNLGLWNGNSFIRAFVVIFLHAKSKFNIFVLASWRG